MRVRMRESERRLGPDDVVPGRFRDAGDIRGAIVNAMPIKSTGPSLGWP